MLVVSDTTALNYLVLIGVEQSLPSLYGQILVPTQVIEELLHEDTPEPVRAWANNPPTWIQLREGDPSSFPLLGPGEAAALALALELNADALLADDLEARLAADSLGLVTVGTLGILGAAHNASLLDFERSIKALRGTSFHMSESVIDLVRNNVLSPKPVEGNDDTIPH